MKTLFPISILLTTVLSTFVCTTYGQQTTPPPPWAWAKKVGDVSAGQGSTQVKAVGTDGVGNVYVAGYLSGTADFDGTPLTTTSGTSVFVAKYSPSGVLLWVKLIRASDMNSFSDMVVCLNGVVTLSGLLASNVVLMRLDASGNYEWISPITANGTVSGTPKLAVDAQGVSYVANDFSGTLTVAGQVLQATNNGWSFLVQVNNAGGATWVHPVQPGIASTPVPNTPMIPSVQALYTDNAGNAHLCYKQTWSWYQSAEWRVVSPTNQLIRTNGGFTSVTQYTQTYGQIQTYDPHSNQFIVSQYKNYYGEASVSVYDDSRTNIWSKVLVQNNYSTYDPPVISSVVPDYQGGIYALGTFALGCSTIGANQICSANTYMNRPWLDYYIFQYDQNVNRFGWLGSYVGVYKAATATDDRLAADTQGNCYLAGTFQDSISLGVIKLKAPTTGKQGFLTKINTSNTLAAAAPRSAAFQVYPQPAQHRVQVDGLPTRATLRLLNVQGQLVRSFPAEAALERQLSLEGVSSGLYLLHVTGPDGQRYAPQKLVVAN